MNMMVTRRALLGGMALGGAAAFLPGSALAFRADGATLYAATNAFIQGFVDRGELAGTLACIRKGQEAPLSCGAGAQAGDRSEERSVGKGCVHMCSTRRGQHTSNTKTPQQQYKT